LVCGLDRPWDIAFLPGATAVAGSMLYTQNDNGQVRAYINASQPGRLLVDIPDVNGSGEGGLMGIAVHPTQPWVYVCYSTNTDNRVVKYTMSFDGAGRPLMLHTPQVILSGISHNDSFHQGCRIRFEPGTTNLFVTTGDNGQGPLPQDPNSLNGKVLRITDAGGNPGNASGKLWYTRGHRNPQGIAFQPGTNVPFSGEHGPGIDDEINRLEDGRNAGWNPTDGTNYDQSKPMTDFDLGPDVFGAVWSSGNPTIALSGIDFIRNGSAASWGTWNGDIVGAVLKNHELRRFDVTPSGSIVGEQKILDDGGTRLRVAVSGPDGALYVATDVPGPGGQIWRVTRA
jgi:glucose/arabinose dehydrogenase